MKVENGAIEYLKSAFVDLYKIEASVVSHLNSAFVELRGTIESQRSKIIEQDKQIVELLEKLDKYEKKEILNNYRISFCDDEAMSKLATAIREEIQVKQKELENLKK